MTGGVEMRLVLMSGVVEKSEETGVQASRVLLGLTFPVLGRFFGCE
jgi:hypothetical protein